MVSDYWSRQERHSPFYASRRFDLSDLLQSVTFLAIGAHVIGVHETDDAVSHVCHFETAVAHRAVRSPAIVPGGVDIAYRFEWQYAFFTHLRYTAIVHLTHRTPTAPPTNTTLTHSSPPLKHILF
jgi:hypothetical protein